MRPNEDVRAAIYEAFGSPNELTKWTPLQLAALVEVVFAALDKSNDANRDKAAKYSAIEKMLK